MSRSVALSAPFLAAGAADGVARVWDLRKAPRDDPRQRPLLRVLAASPAPSSPRHRPFPSREFDHARPGGPPSREVRQVAFARGGARLLTACYDGTASAWAVSGPPAPREVVADHRGHAVERIAVDGDATLASVDFIFWPSFVPRPSQIPPPATPGHAGTSLQSHLPMCPSFARTSLALQIPGLTRSPGAPSPETSC